METKFIEGTNEKYSIREDGVVIRHYRYDKWKNKLIKDYLLKNRLMYDKRKLHLKPVLIVNVNGKIYLVKSLVANYFCTKLAKNKKLFAINHIDNNPENCHYKNLYYVNHPTKQHHAKLARDKSINNIYKHYVANKLGILVNDLTDDMYNLYKTNLKIKRLLTQKTGLHYNTFK